MLDDKNKLKRSPKNLEERIPTCYRATVGKDLTLPQIIDKHGRIGEAVKTVIENIQMVLQGKLKIPYTSFGRAIQYYIDNGMIEYRIDAKRQGNELRKRTYERRDLKKRLTAEEIDKIIAETMPPDVLKIPQGIVEIIYRCKRKCCGRYHKRRVWAKGVWLFLQDIQCKFCEYYGQGEAYFRQEDNLIFREIINGIESTTKVPSFDEAYNYARRFDHMCPEDIDKKDIDIDESLPIIVPPEWESLSLLESQNRIREAWLHSESPWPIEKDLQHPVKKAGVEMTSTEKKKKRTCRPSNA